MFVKSKLELTRPSSGKCQGFEVSNFSSSSQVGAGAARAETRKDWLRAEEEKMKRDREAQWLARSLTEPSPEKPP